MPIAHGRLHSSLRARRPSRRPRLADAAPIASLIKPNASLTKECKPYNPAMISVDSRVALHSNPQKIPLNPDESSEELVKGQKRVTFCDIVTIALIEPSESSVSPPLSPLLEAKDGSEESRTVVESTASKNLALAGTDDSTTESCIAFWDNQYWNLAATSQQPLPEELSMNTNDIESAKGESRSESNDKLLSDLPSAASLEMPALQSLFSPQAKSPLVSTSCVSLSMNPSALLLARMDSSSQQKNEKEHATLSDIASDWSTTGSTLRTLSDFDSAPSFSFSSASSTSSDARTVHVPGSQWWIPFSNLSFSSSQESVTAPSFKPTAHSDALIPDDRLDSDRSVDSLQSCCAGHSPIERKQSNEELTMSSTSPPSSLSSSSIRSSPSADSLLGQLREECQHLCRELGEAIGESSGQELPEEPASVDASALIRLESLNARLSSALSIISEVRDELRCMNNEQL